MPVSAALLKRAIIDVHVIPWSGDVWGVAVEFEHGSTVVERSGTKAQAEARVLQILKDADRLFD